MGWSECCDTIKGKFDDLHDRGTLAPAVVFIVFNTLAGIALLAVSVWLYVDTASYLAGNEHNDKFFISVYILMGVGSLMTLVGFLGCCGAMQESSCMLATFSTFVLLIFAAEVAGAVYGYSHQDEVKTAISKRVKNMITDEYSVQTSVTLAVDTMQRKLHCCGAEGPDDWANSVFNNKFKEPGLLERIGNQLVHKVPLSCCVDESRCANDNSVLAIDFVRRSVYSKGCIEELTEQIEKYLNIIIAVGIGIAVIQIFGFVFSLVLCCAVSGDRY